MAFLTGNFDHLLCWNAWFDEWRFVAKFSIFDIRRTLIYLQLSCNDDNLASSRTFLNRKSLEMENIWKFET